MNILLFAAPGIVGPFVLASLLKRRRERLCGLVIATKFHAVSSSELQNLALQNRVPIFFQTNLADIGFYSQLQEMQLDLLIVASYDQKIPENIIRLPRLGAVNLHPSLLPQYRGACPEFWALRRGESVTGVTLHQLTETFDAGPILEQRLLAIAQDETLGSLLYRVADMSVQLVEHYLDALGKGNNPSVCLQDEAGMTRAPFVQQKDLRIFWSQPAKEILRLVRAANPLGGAWCFFRGEHLKVWYASVVEGKSLARLCEREMVIPGSLQWLNDNQSLCVAVGDGFLELRVIQLSLYFIIDGKGFYFRTRIQEGELLD